MAFLLVTAASLLPFEIEAANLSKSTIIDIGSCAVEVNFLGQIPRIGQTELINWIRRSALAVRSYYGQMPVKKLRIKIRSFDGDEIGFSTTGFVEGVAEIEVPVGAYVNISNLNNDWVLTHEMVHLAFPLVPRSERWLTEGMASYIEPIARHQIGNMSEVDLWTEFFNNMSKGQPSSSQDVLGQRWAIDRIYWGGAIFCLLCDMEIRKSSKNKFGLQQLLAEIREQGGNIDSDLSSLDALELCGRNQEYKLQSKLLLRLYDQFSTRAVKADLPKIFQDLGVEKINGRVILNADAKYAMLRQAISNGLVISTSQKLQKRSEQFRK